MRILVFSDTHNNSGRMVKVIDNMIGVDAVIHCGDGMRDVKEVEKIFPDIKFYYVSGNCDMGEKKYEELIEIEGKKIFVTHGHLYSVKSEVEIEYPTIRDAGREKGADVVLFGHTHLPYNRNWGDIIVMNPGSTKYVSTYGVLETEKGVLKSAVLNIYW